MNESRYKVFEDGTMSGPLTKHKIHFIHIPKNAGTTVMKDFLSWGFGAASHATANQVKNIKSLSGWNNFVVCRDPFKRFVSVYLWRLRKDELVQKLSMEEVIERLSEENIRQPLNEWGWEEDEQKLDRMFNRQITWINERTIRTLRTEHINKDIRDLIIKYNITGSKYLVQKWAKNNTIHNIAKPYGPQPPETTELLIKILNENPQLKEQFFTYYAKDYQKFGYNIPREIK